MPELARPEPPYKKVCRGINGGDPLAKRVGRNPFMPQATLEVLGEPRAKREGAKPRLTVR